jgi:glycosyltransferase involved in cell wall biosynthesis
VVVSETDERKLCSLAPGSRTIVVPNGVDTEHFRPPEGAGRRSDHIVFVGGTYSYPNRDAVEYFLNEVWPHIKVRNGVSFEVVGRSGDDGQDGLTLDESVSFAGHVPDVREPLGTATCSVVPLRIGGGTRLKILDSWAIGTPVVSTSIGSEGLDARDGENILIRDEPREFARAVLELLEDPGLRRRLAEAGRETAVSRYSWDRIGGNLRHAYRGLLS